MCFPADDLAGAQLSLARDEHAIGMHNDRMQEPYLAASFWAPDESFSSMPASARIGRMETASNSEEVFGLPPSFKPTVAFCSRMSSPSRRSSACGSAPPAARPRA